MSDAMQERYEKFLKDFETVVSIDSSSDNLDGVAEVAAFFKERYEALGLEVVVSREGERGVPCLKAVTPSKDGRYDFMFLGHMDTVFPTGEIKKRPFAIKDGKATGPGVSDMKGGLLIALHTLEALKEESVLDKFAVCVVYNGDEEVGSKHSRPLIEACAKQCDRVFVFEPCRPGYRHVLQRKGGGWFKVIARGVASHAGADPEKGRNALVELAHQIVRINEFNNVDNDITAQCTVISSGDKVNIIPDYAELSVDVRVGTMEEMEIASRFFAELPNTTFIDGTSIEVTGGIDRPPLESVGDAPEMFAIMQAEGEKVGVQAEGISTGGCSDGNFTAALGVPTIDGMGTVGDGSHRVDEHVQLDSIIPRIKMVVGTCKKIILG